MAHAAGPGAARRVRRCPSRRSSGTRRRLTASPRPAGYTGAMASGRVSLDEFLGMDGADAQRLELLDGEVRESPESDPVINTIVAALRERLERCGTTLEGVRIVVPSSAQFADSSLLPKLIYYRTNPPAQRDRISRPPDVAVEAISPGQSRLEMRTK